MSDAYVETLGHMVSLLQEYKPGLITLDNVTRLCKTLRLESFTDNIDSNTVRLSAASNIIVIDMDFHKSEKQVKDVKMVLASNFDNFNYYNDGDNGNILFNALNCFPDLQTFYYNLKFLSVLDTHSIVETEAASSPKREKVDLFRYFTELPEQLRSYFKDAGINAELRTNVDNKFGIYVFSEDVQIAKISIEECDSSLADRFYDYRYVNHGWSCESLESVTSGVMLTLQICDTNMHFPQELISRDLVLDAEYQSPFNIVNHQKSILLFNEATSSLIPASKFNISNENIDLLGELLKWVTWWQKVLSKVLQALKCPAPQPLLETKTRQSSNSAIMASQRRTSITRRRRSSQKGHRPSLNDSSMMKDGGLQQFTLNEVMSQAVIEDDEPGEKTDLILDEDSVTLGNERCDSQMGVDEWNAFMEKFMQLVVA
ncbi:LAME_0E05556g1_1 [Lachancea meyersii CBS 8951]|uniref:Mediator of RNA polymerase II transcription subunit 1 n=1 Tax=Lachancea meyersii CBS 8951 TaxID=1266667 RepID=A0A1G4JHI0_9SACH|nr:LAME_0E05556g1_1 [Lachancea meyersii CBS 8951]